MTTRYKHAMSPLQIGQVTIPNRVVRTAHGTLFSRGDVTDVHTHYHLARARGGAGLSFVECSSVHRSSNFSLTMTDDASIPPLRRLADTIRPTGMKLFAQLWHGGQVEPAPNGGPPWSVTTLPGRYSRMRPIAMSTRQIAELVRAYGDAAVRLAEAGLDGAEVLAGAGYLHSLVLSPVLNTRTDAYGGSFENRVRFLEEVLTEIRSRVPASFALGARMGSSSDQSLLSTADVNRAILHLEGKGLLDYINVTQGDYFYHVERYAAMDKSVGYQMDAVRETLKGVGIPRLVTGRFGTMDDVEQTLRAGDADMVSLVRAMIADPDLVRKEVEGRGTEVRPCIGCNQGCIGGLFSGRMSCAVNPTVGLEGILGEDLIVPAAEPRKVVVVGGGPAGMEAARVAALAGHKVTLFEAAPDLGGQINLASHLPHNHGIGDIVKWQEREIFRLGVEVNLSSYVEVDEVLALNPDIVILATGSMSVGAEELVQTAAPHLEVPIDGAAQVLTPEDLIVGNHRDLGKTAVVFDDVGHYEAIGCCEHLLEQGLDVTYVTRHTTFAPEIDKTGRAQAALRRFYRMDGSHDHGNAPVSFRICGSSLITTIRKGEVEFRPLDGIHPETVPADTVVLVTFREAFRELWDDCEAAGVEVYAIGDALSARDLVVAIREGHLCARSIDNPDLMARWNNM
ncbi:MAG: FAD-dependent oxidoreductase [Amaricoccus sp.]|uniref:FAD-dependent oxidoreductase n=1 Tax=Amaricoccus sp. TaxID=1872485 RepID=UPI0039E2B60D